MAKLFIGCVPSRRGFLGGVEMLTIFSRGLAWHTTDETLREGFEQFGAVEEAVSRSLGKDALC